MNWIPIRQSRWYTLPDVNVFREDEVTNGDGRKDSLANAPKAKEDQYIVPKTV